MFAFVKQKLKSDRKILPKEINVDFKVAVYNSQPTEIYVEDLYKRRPHAIEYNRAKDIHELSDDEEVPEEVKAERPITSALFRPRPHQAMRIRTPCGPRQQRLDSITENNKQPNDNTVKIVITEPEKDDGDESEPSEEEKEMDRTDEPPKEEQKEVKKPETAKGEKKPESPKVAEKPEPPKIEKKPEPQKEEKKPEPPKPEKKPEPPKQEKKPEPPKAEKKPEPQKEQKKNEPAKEDKKEMAPVETGSVSQAELAEIKKHIKITKTGWIYEKG